MADQAHPTPPQAPEPTYELEWESRAQQPKRRSRLSRLFPIGGGAAPEDPEAVAPAPPPPPPRRPSSFQRKPLPGATAAAIPTPAAPSTSDDDLVQQASFAKEAQQQQQQHQPPLARDEAPAAVGLAEQEPASSDKVATAGAGATRSSRWARLDAVMPPDRRYLGMRRRVFLVAAATLLLLLLALIIGLAVGLSARKSDGQRDLPLPGSDGGRTHEGELTFYDPGLGACGGSHGGGDMIAAVARSVFDAAANKGDGNPNNNPICGRRIRVERGDGSVDVVVVDRCEGCKPTDLDLSPSAFQRLAREEDGRVVGQWRWL
ncbi:hypothetical protein RB595_008182 [Gaeumannomyces hyphopodioides]